MNVNDTNESKNTVVYKLNDTSVLHSIFVVFWLLFYFNGSFLHLMKNNFTFLTVLK